MHVVDRNYIYKLINTLIPHIFLNVAYFLSKKINKYSFRNTELKKKYHI